MSSDEEYFIKRIESLESENNYLKEKYDKLKQEIESLAEFNSKMYRYSTGEIAFVEAHLSRIYTPIMVSILDERCKFLKENKQNEKSGIQDKRQDD